MTLAFAIVCEAEADFRTSSGLADRVFCEDVRWIEEEVLDGYRGWRGLDDAQDYLPWTRAATLAQEAGFRVHGHFDGAPGEPDAQAARRALWLFARSKRQLDGVLLIRDDDRQTNRRMGLEQARQESRLPCPIVIGLAHLKRECWVLAGFEPKNDHEGRQLSSLREELDFDPCTESHRLTAGGEAAHRSPKRVLRILTNGDFTRQSECWHSASLALLVQRGQPSGLAEYLEEVRSRLVPLFTGRTSNSAPSERPSTNPPL
jgi:hypothetical protein